MLAALAVLALAVLFLAFDGGGKNIVVDGLAIALLLAFGAACIARKPAAMLGSAIASIAALVLIGLLVMFIVTIFGLKI